MDGGMRLAVVETAAHGGLLHYAVQLGDALAGRGHAVDLIVPCGNELSERSGPARRREILAPPTPDPNARFANVRTIRRAGVAVRLLRAWGRINWELRRDRYDAAILTSDVDLSPMALAVLAVTMRRGMLVAGVCHSVRPLNRWAGEEMFASSPLLSSLLRAMYARMDFVFVHGERSLSEFRATWPRANVLVIPHGDERIFSEDPPPPSEEERLLFFGEWRKVKGLDILMRAFEQLAERRPQARLTIAGEPCAADMDPGIVRSWAAAQEGRVRVEDRYIPVSEVPALFGSARAVVTPYLVGYQSGVVHLAMTMGRAVVASDVGDLGSVVVDGETGLTVPPGDAPALADALERILSDRELTDRLGHQARARLMEGSSWEGVAERVESSLRRGEPIRR
jgi:glycosyltransferase involved in cell wall biosynthesis